MIRSDTQIQTSELRTNHKHIQLFFFTKPSKLEYLTPRYSSEYPAILRYETNLSSKITQIG